MSLILGLFCVFGSWLADVYVSDIVSCFNKLSWASKAKLEPAPLPLTFIKIKV